MPRNLEPQPADAADSLPQDRDTGGADCADFTQVDQGACVFGDKSADRTVVLFGDSHMEQWLPAFTAAADRDHWQVLAWTKSACPAAEISVHNDVLNRTYTECDQWRARRSIASATSIPTWSSSVSPETVIPGSVSPTTYADALASTMRKDWRTEPPALSRSCRTSRSPAATCPGASPRTSTTPPGAPSPPSGPTSYPDRHAAIEPALSAVDVGIIPTQPWFCTTPRVRRSSGTSVLSRRLAHDRSLQRVAPAAGPIRAERGVPPHRERRRPRPHDPEVT